MARSQFATIFIVSAAIGVVGFMLSLTLPKPTMDRTALEADEDQFSLASFVSVFRRSDLWPWYLVTVVNMFLVGLRDTKTHLVLGKQATTARLSLPIRFDRPCSWPPSTPLPGSSWI